MFSVFLSSQGLFARTLFGVFCLLCFSSVTAWLLKIRAHTHGTLQSQALFNHIIVRINAWWIMVSVLTLAFLGGLFTTVVLFLILSIFALREFFHLISTQKIDKNLIFLAFFVFTPLQYAFVLLEWYGMFVILIPVYAFMIIPFVSALSGNTAQFLSRTANFQWALMLCVYSVSHVPAFLMLPFENSFTDRNMQLILFFVIVVQLSDVLQFVFGKLFGSHALAPLVSPNKTWEGLIGGIFSATLVGVLLQDLTPFNVWQTILICITVLFAGFAGGLCMSAIKRDRGIKDFGTLINGHGGVLDRLDSIVFSAPLFFHICRYWFI